MVFNLSYYNQEQEGKPLTILQICIDKIADVSKHIGDFIFKGLTPLFIVWKELLRNTVNLMRQFIYIHILFLTPFHH